MKNSFVCYGEVLWDIFPTHKKIGGAPLNVAIRLRSFDNEVSMLSCVGNDERGKSLVSFIQSKKVNTDYISISNDYPTGEVKVTLDEKGSASYDIRFPSSWDYIPMEAKSLKLVQNADAFIFGSLVTRNEYSKSTLFKLLENTKYNIFDVNLRKPYYQKETLIELMSKADFIKFNDDELYEISKMLGSKYSSLEQNISFIAEHTQTKSLCVTKGRHGAVLLYDNQLYYNSGYFIKVVDTVGAGDSFLATLINMLFNKEKPQKAIDYACGVGALVAQSEGANPEFSQHQIEKFINPYDI